MPSLTSNYAIKLGIIAFVCIFFDAGVPKIAFA
jgi:hypothetical protein